MVKDSCTLVSILPDKLIGQEKNICEMVAAIALSCEQTQPRFLATARKVMAIEFSDACGIIFIGYLQNGQTE